MTGRCLSDDCRVWVSASKRLKPVWGDCTACWLAPDTGVPSGLKPKSDWEILVDELGEEMACGVIAACLEAKRGELTILEVLNRSGMV